MILSVAAIAADSLIYDELLSGEALSSDEFAKSWSWIQNLDMAAFAACFAVVRDGRGPGTVVAVQVGLGLDPRPYGHRF